LNGKINLTFLLRLPGLFFSITKDKLLALAKDMIHLKCAQNKNFRLPMLVRIRLLGFFDNGKRKDLLFL